ncbi:MAG: methyl-accepting chemotaxis protein [Paraburkholderia sp.]|uniref:methyl-accepting chemotaxis protein n=1 Tax=Paraburkholderia sp. TaxID=1926495 RepID=UPI00397DD3CD
MTLSRRLLLTLSVALAALVFLATFGLWRLNQAQQRFEYVQSNIIPSIKELGNVKSEIGNYARLNYRYLLSTDDADRAAAETTLDALNQSVDQHIGTYLRDDISDDIDRQMVESDKANLAAYRAAMKYFQAKARGGDLEDAKAMLVDGGAVRNAFATMTTGVDNHIAYNDKLSHDLGDANNQAYSRAFWLLASCATLALMATGGLGFQLYRSITSGLTSIQQTLQRVSQSLDLTHTAKVERMDEIGHTATALNALLERVAEVVGEVRRTAGSVSVASRQIATGNTDLSQRTEEQAASLEETASSMEELTVTVSQNADNARQATTLANVASEVALRGGKVVGRVVETMHEISDSSTKIAEIISVIEGIAFQTNILALNAAVEAARAGEQGRGFAVVAGEVRTLAQSSAIAAKEIKDLIGDSVSRVDAGSKLVDEAGSTISEIVQSVKRVSDIVGEIASASEEQRSGIEQVNKAVIQMDKVTQQNAALVEEASAAAQSMADQAKGLQAVVTVFRIAETGHLEPHVVTQRSEPRRVATTVRVVPRAPLTKSNATAGVAGEGNTPVAADVGAGDWQTF